MNVAYPVRLTPQQDGKLLVSFPDVPEALTEGATRAEALSEAVDCLHAALGGYILEGRDLPEPSAAEPGQPTVVLPPLVAAKAALYRAMRAARLAPAALGRQLHMDERSVRRLLDLDHRSHLEQIEAALGVFGKRLIVEVQDAA